MDPGVMSRLAVYLVAVISTDWMVSVYPLAGRGDGCQWCRPAPFQPPLILVSFKYVLSFGALAQNLGYSWQPCFPVEKSTTCKINFSQKQN